MLTRGAATSALLVVDDEPHVLAAIKDLLEDDYTVFTETSAKSALEFLGGGPSISVIISDQRMPDMDGDEFLARAREVSKASRILITGYADLKAVVRAINDGQIFGYISKPWNTTQLAVTVHKAAEYFEMSRDLAQAQALLHNLMDSIPDAVFFKTADRRFLRVNRPMARLLGIVDPAQAVGRTAEDFWPAGRAREVAEEEEEIARTRRPLTDRIERVESTEGVERWFSKTVAPVLDDHGQVVSLTGVARDITERERSRQALLESERRFRTIYNNTPVMMHSSDRSGQLESVNDYWCEVLGYAREEVIGRRSIDFMTDASRLRFEAEVRPEFRRTGEVKGVECQFVSKGGRIVDTLLSAVAGRDEWGNIVKALAVMIDVTEKKALQSQLLQSQKMEAIGHLTGGIAHDFNNLLTVVIGNLDLLAEDLPPASPFGELVDQASRAAARGAELTHRLLAFSRRQVLDPTTLDLNEAIASLTGMISRSLGERIEVRTVLAPGLWLVRVDAAQFESAIINLCVNARDAMENGGSLSIETANVVLDAGYARRHPDLNAGEFVSVQVKDTGNGMPASVMERVFEPFFTTKEEGKGTGLGLSMVYGFVKQSDGHVEIESKVGRGTCVRLLFPRLKSSGSARSVERPPDDAPRGTETVLVVEDQDDVRAIGVRMLENLGYKVLTANHGPAAIAILESGAAVDLLFTDMVMPGPMSGLELAMKARSMRPELRVLFTSGYTDTANYQGKTAIEGSEWIAKPYLRRRLAERVRKVLDA